MKLFSMLRKDLLILFRSRAEMVVLFLMPLAFILPISFALGQGDGYGINRNNRMVLLPVADYDGGPRALALRSAIGESIKLEKDYGLGLIEELGLSGDPSCALPIRSSTPTVEPTEAPAAPAPTFLPEPTNAVTATAAAKLAATQAAEPTATLTVTPTPTATPEPGSENLITNPACIEQVGRALLARSRRPAVLIIPPGFSEAVEAGQTVEARLLIDPAGDSTLTQQIEGVVKGATIRMSVQDQVEDGLGQLTDLAALAPQDVRQSIDAQASAPLPDRQPVMRIEKVAPEYFQARPFPDTYQQTVPGYAVMYVFFIITSMNGSIRQERLSGTFRRLLSAPVSRVELLSSKLLASIIIGMAQVFLLFGVGALLFKLNLGNDPLAFFLLSGALVTAAAAIGLAAATTRVRGGGLAAPLVILALLGGCMFPLDLMPSFLRTLSVIAPHSWALTGYQNLMVRGLGLQDIFPQIMALFSFALVFFLIALVRFDFESQ